MQIEDETSPCCTLFHVLRRRFSHFSKLREKLFQFKSELNSSADSLLCRTLIKYCEHKLDRSVSPIAELHRVLFMFNVEISTRKNSGAHQQNNSIHETKISNRRKNFFPQVYQSDALDNVPENSLAF